MAQHVTVPQYSRAKIAVIWAAATLPMALLSWAVAPWLKGSLGEESPLAKALLLSLTVGLIWQFVLVVVLVAREQGSLRWSLVRQALWLRAPRDPKTGRKGGRVWLWLLVFMVAFGLLQELPLTLPAPSQRDLGEFLQTDASEDLFRGAWGWFALVVVLAVFNTVLGEELLFRGLLLPRMQGAFGRADWLANGILTGVYHLHLPWAIPSSVVTGLIFSFPSRRFESALMGILVHSAQNVVVLMVLLLVLD